MMRKPEPAQLRYLGIEGGGTRTVALLADGRGQALRRLETGPANMKLLTERQLTERFRSIARARRNPKSETNPNSQVDNAQNQRAQSRLGLWNFPVGACFGFRVSDFGFDLNGPVVLARSSPTPPEGLFID